jgi:hypothetical protein
MMAHEIIAIGLYLVMIPVMATIARDNGASIPTALAIGIAWPISAVIAVIWMGIKS